jgi:hypothetical protein
MSEDTGSGETEQDPNQAFFEKAERALRDLFDRAKAAHELHFAMALMPEFRGEQDAGWSTADESVRAYDEFAELVRSLPKTPARVRVVLAFYMHVAEGAGFYEIPKKLLLTIEGRGNNMWPFQNLVERHRASGEIIAPNANQIMKDLIGHASELGLTELAEVFRDAFDPGVRNAVAHADYIIWPDGLRLRRRNGGWPREIPWKDFTSLADRGLNLFAFIRHLSDEYVHSYETPKTIRSRMNKNEPLTDYTIYYQSVTGAFGFTTGRHPPSSDALSQGSA